MSIGAFCPGIRAVEMMMSTSFACLANNAISASINSFDMTFAYPPAPSPDSWKQEFNFLRFQWSSHYIHSGNKQVANNDIFSPVELGKWWMRCTLMSTSKNSAPIDWTCSRTASRVSNPLTMAPMFFAVPIEARPATPPPITSTFAGGTFPAAVIWPKLVIIHK